jgi:hypothetical protein
MGKWASSSAPILVYWKVNTKPLGGTTMQITVSITLARETVQKHYEAHKQEYALQLEGWQEKMKEYTAKVTAWAADGGTDHQRPSQPRKPENFESTYKRLLKMLELHNKLDLTLDEDQEFNEIFLDKFRWKSTFFANSATYGGTLLSAGEEDDDL